MRDGHTSIRFLSFTMMTTKRVCWILLLAAGWVVDWLSPSCVASGEIVQQVGELKSRSPNFVFILSDDQGWNGMSASMHPVRDDARSDFFLTPHLERLAQQGMRFSQGYAPAALCCPTRRSLQFGQSPLRIGNQRFAERYPVGTERLTIPRMLKAIDERYRSAHFGKWDLRSDLLPEHLGYDESDGNTGNRNGNEGSMFNTQQKWRRHHATDDPKKIFSITERSVDFITRAVAARRPFYLQVSHYAVHADQQTRPESFEQFESRRPGELHHIPGYGGMTADLDAGIGKLLEAIDQLGIADSTYVLFMSDNGGVPWVPPDKIKHFANPLSLADKSRNHPLRAGKWTLFEGGIRVPFIVRGPGVEPGSFCDVPVVGWDLLPTIADLAGYGLELPADLDGRSFKTLLHPAAGKNVANRSRDLVFHRYSKEFAHSAIRAGRYKLVKFWHAPDPLLLFDLENDLGETRNLAKMLPEQAGKLDRRLTEYMRTVGAEFLDDP